VVNARDAMPRGGRLTIETSNVELDEEYASTHGSVIPGRHVMLAVSDTGVGMDADTIRQIFEPFFTTKGPEQGTGLGLATVYGIVKQSGGNIWVYSEPGQGATFKVYLPLVDEPLEPRTAPARAVEKLGGSETILLVEDEASVRDLAIHVLTRRGYRVVGARDGEEALRLVEQHAGPIDLVLTDVVLPRMSGRELISRLAPRVLNAAVLFMSGYTHNAIQHHGVLERGIEFLQKPFGPNDLARRVREVLDARKVR
jgi:CheY-like chemotaxis protein